MDLLKILRKRWKIAASLFVLTLVATAGALIELPWSYVAQANVLLLPSNSMSKPYGGNPYLAFDYTLTQTANVIQLEATDASTSATLAAQGDTASYTVEQAPNASAPVLLISVTGGNKEIVEDTLTGVLQQLDAELHAAQSSVRTDNRITDQVIAASQTPSRETSKKARPLVGVFAGGLILTIGIPALINAIAARRSTQRSRPGRDTGATQQVTENLERPSYPSRQPADMDLSPAAGTDVYRNEYWDDYRDPNRRYAGEQGPQGRGNY